MTGHQCPGCGAETQRIAVPTALQPGSKMPPGYIIYYEPDAKLNFWTGRVPILGHMAPELCSKCDLVSWFAVRNLESLPVPADHHDRADLPVVPEPEPNSHAND